MSLTKWAQPRGRLPKDEQKLTAVKEDEVTPLPQVRAPPETPQLPLEVVKLTLDPEVVKVMVAQVWVDHVPAVRRQPVPEAARRYPLLGTPVPYWYCE